MNKSYTLFRFEDNFEPTNHPRSAEDWAAALKYIKGECSSFYSYGTNLISCMAKYYHYPTEGEKASLYVKENCPPVGLDVGHFPSVDEARAIFAKKCPNESFPAEYPSIEDGEVLLISKLDDCLEFRFGYSVYFLVMLNALIFTNEQDMLANFDLVAKYLVRVPNSLKQYKIQVVTQADMTIAKKLLSLHYRGNSAQFTVQDVLNMPVWATTFPEEVDRNDILYRLYGNCLAFLIHCNGYTCKCTSVNRDAKGTIVSYTIQDRKGFSYNYPKDSLKQAILDKKISVTNLKRTVDNKLRGIHE